MIASPDGSPVEPALEIERVEWLPSTPETLEVRVCGRWRGKTPTGSPELVVATGGERRRFRATGAAAADGGVWEARFVVPVELRSALGARLTLQAGARELALPAALPGPADGTSAPPPATVVDPGVLASLRARREGQADEGLLRRAQSAEAIVATLETQLGHVETRLRDMLAERERAGARLRAAEQRAEAERRVRAEVQEEGVAAQASSERSLAALRERVRAAEEHAAALAAEMDAIRREGAEAQHAAASARVQAERVLRTAHDPGRAQAQIAGLRDDAASLSQRLSAERRSRAQAEAEVARQAARVEELRTAVDRLEGELARRTGLQRDVAHEVAGLREALAQVRAQAEAQAVQGDGARSALEKLETTAAGLRTRLSELGQSERVARVAAREAEAALDARTRELSRAAAELERLRAELGAARAAGETRAAALREAERTVEAARRQAAELQVRLDDETRRRFEAEAALRVDLQREREAFAAEVAAVEREVGARIAAEREAYEGQAAEIERLVGEVRSGLATARGRLEERMVEAVRRRDAALAERDAAIGERDAALADIAATKREIAAELEAAATERELLAQRLAEAQAEVAAVRSEAAAARRAAESDLQEARRAAESDLQQVRHAAESDLQEVGGDLAGRLVEAEAAREALSAEVATRDEELARLRALIESARSGEAELGALVEAVAARTGAVGESFERMVAGRSERIDAETAQLRSQLDAEQRARWVVEQELAAERERGASADRPGLADALVRSELESMRRDLAAAQERIAADRVRPAPEREQASRLVADLGAAETRLKRDSPADPSETAPAGVDPSETAPAGVDSSETAPAGVDSSETAPGGADRSEAGTPDPVPFAARVVAAPDRRPTPWLSRSLATLSHADPDAALELFLALLPAQGGALRDPLSYAMLVAGQGAYRVDVGARSATVEPGPPTEVSAGTQVTVSAPLEQLVPLAAGSAPRRLRGLRVNAGRRRHLRRLTRARRRPLDLADLVRRGLDLPPVVVLEALVAAIEPSWTAGHAFTVRYALDGGAAADVVVFGDRTPTVRRVVAPADTEAHAAGTAPGGGVVLSSPVAPDAIVALPKPALVALLARTEIPAGPQPTVAGDPHVVALLHAWFDRAQGLEGPRQRA